MKLNKNNAPYYVTGTELTYSRLKTMPKDKLIEYLCTAQFNYESINERLYSMSQYAKRLEKALDLACEVLDIEDGMLFDFYDRCLDTYYDTKDKHEWKKYLLESIEEDERR